MPHTLGTGAGRESASAQRRVHPVPLVNAGPTEARASLRHPDEVVRRRLLSLMDVATRGPLTVVSAPAGYGKTVLVTTWAARLEGRATVAQMTLTDNRQSVVDFWTAALESLRAGGIDTSGLNLGPSPVDVGVATLMRIAQRLGAHRQPVVWILDCDEFALTQAVGSGLHRMIGASGGALHLVLLTRSDPPLPLHRYRLTDQLTEIRAADLAFTMTEAATLIQRTGLDLSPSDVAALQARTAGWPAGLRFAAMSLAGRDDSARALREFRGDTGNVGAYLMTEVLAKQPAEMQLFLLRTCLVDTLHPGLVSALTGRHCDHRVLQSMAQRNTFIVPVRGGEGGYRYQPLFREFLRSELAYRHPDLVPELHRSAAAWLASTGRPRGALRHAVAAQSWDEAATYLVDGTGVAALLVGRDRIALRELVAALPADAPGSGPAVARAALALSNADPGACLAELDVARRVADVAPVSPSGAKELAIVVLGAVAASLGTDLDAALDAVMAAESAVLTAATPSPGPQAETLTLVAASKGRTLLERGDLAAASAAFAAAIAAATTAGLDGVGVELRGMQAIAEAAAGNLCRASELAGWVPSDAAGAPGTASVAASCKAGALALAWVRVEEYNLMAAADLLDELPQLQGSDEGRLLRAVHALVRARLLRASGQADLAMASVRAACGTGRAETGATWIDHALVVSQADSLVAAGHPDEASGVLHGLDGCGHPGCALSAHRTALARGLVISDVGEGRPTPYPGPAPTVQDEVESLLVRAGQSLQEGHRGEAERSVEAALDLAVPEHLCRPFFESPTQVRELLEETGRMSRLRQRATRAESHHDTDIALTVREQEVLGHLAELLTTEEIAQSMFVSVNTVRSHVRSVLRKLDVTRRNEAVRRAWELDLLPGGLGHGAPNGLRNAHPNVLLGRRVDRLPTRGHTSRTG